MEICELAADRVHGAAWITQRAIEALQRLTGTERTRAAVRLLRAQPAMASLFHVANTILLTGSPPDASKLQLAFDAATHNACLLVHAHETVLTHSRSATVEAVLLSVRPRVLCTESQPLGEGIALAASLQAAGLEVVSVADEQ